MNEQTQFKPFKHMGGDLYQRIGGPDGFHWRHISRDMAWGHIVDLVSEAGVAESLGDTVHAKRLAKDANCLLTAVGEHDEWHRCMDRPAAANDRQRESA